MTALGRFVSGDLRVFLGALVALTILAVVTVLTSPKPAPALSVHNEREDGAMALRLWLERSGYPVSEVLADPVDADELDVLFILNPLTQYGDAEGQYLYNWVMKGNTLIIVGAPYYVESLLEPHDLDLEFVFSGVALSSGGPTLSSPPVGPVQVDARYVIESQRPDLVEHLSTEQGPVLVSLRAGEGTLWLSGASRPFTNRGLHDPASARLILNLLAQFPQHARIGFDEARHGFAETPESLLNWLVGSPPGLGISLGLGITMLYLALRGRRFGSVLPVPYERLRREPVEYIVALANMLRRSGQRKATLSHYRGQFRRRLSERYGLDPRLDDRELVKTLVFHDPAIDEAALRRLLRRLSQDSLSEQELVSTALEVDIWLKHLR